MNKITEHFSGHLPAIINVIVDEPGIYILKSSPKACKVTVNGIHSQVYQLEHGHYTLRLTGPKSYPYKLFGKLMLSDEKREQTIREMKLDLANDVD